MRTSKAHRAVHCRVCVVDASAEWGMVAERGKVTCFAAEGESFIR